MSDLQEYSETLQKAVALKDSTEIAISKVEKLLSDIEVEEGIDGTVDARLQEAKTCLERAKGKVESLVTLLRGN